MLELHELERKGLASMVASVALLLERLAGIEIALDGSDEQPELVIAEGLNRCAELSIAEASHYLMQICAGQPAFRYRVGCTHCAQLWNPLDESLRHYQQRLQTVVCWYDGALYPAPYATVRWLQELRC